MLIKRDYGLQLERENQSKGYFIEQIINHMNREKGVKENSIK